MQILTTFFLFVSGFWRFSHYEQRNGLEHIMTKFCYHLYKHFGRHRNFVILVSAGFIRQNHFKQCVAGAQELADGGKVPSNKHWG
jgi:hypothetical protein